MIEWFTTEMIPLFVDIGEFLTQPIFTIGDLKVNLLAVFGTTILTIIITAKIIALAIPN